MHYLCSENKGADQLCGYRTADLRLCFSHMQKKNGFLMTRILMRKIIGHIMVSAIKSSSVTLLICQTEPNHSLGFHTRYDMNRTEPPQKMARCLPFRLKEEKGCYLAKTKGAEAISCAVTAADLGLCFRICKLWFSHEVAQIRCILKIIKRIIFVNCL